MNTNWTRYEIILCDNCLPTGSHGVIGVSVRPLANEDKRYNLALKKALKLARRWKWGEIAALRPRE